jgi:hypothetical protein
MTSAEVWNRLGVFGLIPVDASPLSGATMHEVCDVCSNAIIRDCNVNTAAPPTAEWLGVCECANRKWRWRSVTGEALWELIGGTDL